jgi:hypothetical protein
MHKGDSDDDDYNNNIKTVMPNADYERSKITRECGIFILLG